MKLIIDIPDYMYDFVKAKRINGIHQVFDAYDAILVSKYVREGIPLPEELEEIKAEIEQDAFKDVNGSKYIFVNRVNQIIDKYKAEREELKGENNES